MRTGWILSSAGTEESASPPVAGSGGAGPEVGPLSLAPEEDEEFDDLIAIGAEPVRYMSVGRRGLARLEDQPEKPGNSADRVRFGR